MKGWKIIVLLLLVISIVSSAVALTPRLSAERENKYVDAAISFKDIKDLAKERNETIEKTANYFREVGVNSILYKENSLNELKNNGSIDIINRQGILALGLEKPPFEGNESYILISDQDTYNQVLKHLTEKLGEEKIVVLPKINTINIIAVDYSFSQLANTGVGFDSKTVKLLENMGFHTIFMLKEWPNINENSIQFTFRDLNLTADNISAVLFEKKQVLGFPNYLPVVAREFKKYNIPLGQIEFYKQIGFTKLATLMEKQVLRLHRVTDGEMLTISHSAIVDRYSLAARERNIRLLFFKFLPATDSESRIRINQNYMGKTIKKLNQNGFKVELGKDSTPKTFTPIPQSRKLLFLISLGPIAAGVLLLERLIVKRKSILIALLLLATILMACGFFFVPLLARKITALATVVIFPSLSIIYFIPTERTNIPKAILCMIKMTAFSLIGAVITSAVLADVSFMLKLDQFTGVKVAYLLPVMLVACVFYIIYGKSSFKDRFKELLDKPILVKYVIMLGILFIVAIVYVSRTGNEAAVGVSTLELKFRALLDRLLGVRPRTKEFMIGHPLMLLLLYLGYHKDHRYLPLLVLGSIGQTSMVNTFAHIHTPFIISVIRSVEGVLLGIIIGIVLIYLVRALVNLIKRWQNA